MNQIGIHRVSSLDLTCEPWDWPFARDRRAAIDEHFAQEKIKKPTLFNGTILLMHEAGIADSALRGRYFEADFASFLSWRDFGFPGEGVTNGFGMGALRGKDGAFLVGEMAQHTANAGRIYFPSGTPDRNDVVAGRVDVAGSIVREVAEETGLTEADYEAEPLFYCVSAKPLLAIIQVLNLTVEAGAARERILANLARQKMPEFSAVHLVRDARDILPAMPAFVGAFLRAMTAGVIPGRA